METGHWAELHRPRVPSDADEAAQQCRAHSVSSVSPAVNPHKHNIIQLVKESHFYNQL